MSRSWKQLFGGRTRFARGCPKRLRKVCARNLGVRNVERDQPQLPRPIGGGGYFPGRARNGLTFLGNRLCKLARVEPLFETATGSIVHAEGRWEDQDPSGPNTVAIGFGPQHGPVTAEQVEELVRASRRYDELVIAGFSFDAA